MAIVRDNPYMEKGPHLSERDARLISEKVVECLRALGVLPSRFGVALSHEGFWFSAEIDGKLATARTGQGNFTYAHVARDLALAATDPDWNRLIVEGPHGQTAA